MSEPDQLQTRFRELLDQARAMGGEPLLERLRDQLDAVLAPPTVHATPEGEVEEEWHGLVGICPPMLQLRKLIGKFAPADAPVLITGESGTGKERVATALHAMSRRKDQPLIAENCAAIPDTLLESVLFGHARGAFTGAIKDHPGHFVAADGGTLFLDEIGDMKLPMQVKLLRALQEGEVRPVGGVKVRKVNVRVITATNADLENNVKVGRFREDLFFRLNVLRLSLPPLRERGHDTVILARRFLLAAAERAGRRVRLSKAAEDAIRTAPWPGNVRQLQNEMQRLAALCDGPEAKPTDLSNEVFGR